MTFNTTLFFSALGLAFILEALPYVLAPEHTRKSLLQLAVMPAIALRLLGLAGFALGFGVLCFTLWR